MAKIKEVKKRTDLFFKKHPANEQNGLTEEIKTDYVTELCKQAARADISKIEMLIIDIFKYGYMQGMKQSKGSSRAANTAIPSRNKLDELAAVLAAYETK
jgi:hypothetical protein